MRRDAAPAARTAIILTPARAELSRAIADGAATLSAVVAALDVRGLQTASDLRLVRHYERVVSGDALALRTDKRLAALRREIDRAVATFRDRLPADARTAVPELAVAPAAGRAPSVRKRRRPQRMPLAALPPASFLEDVEARRVSWHDAITARRAPKELSLSEVADDAALLDDVTKRRLLLKARDERGLSARAAFAEQLERSPAPHEVRWAQRVLAKGPGAAALADGRRRRTTACRVMVPLVQALTLLYYHGRRGASARILTRLVNTRIGEYEERARADGFLVPFPRATSASIASFISRLPSSVRLVRKDGFEGWAKQRRMVDRRDEAEYANHIWEIDHTRLDIAAVASADDPESVVTLWATACVDAESDVPLVVSVSSRAPDAFTTSLVLSRAIREQQIGGVRLGGLPTILRPDHGRDFTSSHVGRVAKALPITLDHAAEHNPDGKPHVERFFRTLNGALAAHPGYKPTDGRSDGAARKQRDRLLTARAVIQDVEAIRLEYAQRRPERGSPSPIERYAASVKWRWPENPDELDLLLLKSDETRVLTREGVRFRNKLYKGWPGTAEGHTFDDFVGQRVEIRYHPDDDASIIIYVEATGLRLGEFVREELWQGRASASQVNASIIPDLKQRTIAYGQRLTREDRAVACSDRAREIAEVVEERRAAAADAGRAAPTREEVKRGKAAARAVQEDAALYEDLY